jgi:hypothetical protein
MVVRNFTYALQQKMQHPTQAYCIKSGSASTPSGMQPTLCTGAHA